MPCISAWLLFDIKWKPVGATNFNNVPASINFNALLVNVPTCNVELVTSTNDPVAWFVVVVFCDHLAPKSATSVLGKLVK